MDSRAHPGLAVAVIRAGLETLFTNDVTDQVRMEAIDTCVDDGYVDAATAHTRAVDFWRVNQRSALGKVKL
ncbi:MAG: hypothetical protein WEB04_04100 [Dehalococcoidia bacterium]